MLDTLLALLMALLMIAFGLFCGVNAFWLFIGQLKTRRLAERSQNWAITQGRVEQASVEHVGTRAGWKPTIQYNYHANSVEYTGERVVFNYFETYSRKEADAIMERYPVQKNVKVFYDPDRPQESTLEQIHVGTVFSLLFLPLFLLMPAGLCLCSGLMGLAGLWKK